MNFQINALFCAKSSNSMGADKEAEAIGRQTGGGASERLRGGGECSARSIETEA